MFSNRGKTAPQKRKVEEQKKQTAALEALQTENASLKAENSELNDTLVAVVETLNSLPTTTE